MTTSAKNEQPVENSASASSGLVMPFFRKETMLMNIFEREGWYENRVSELETEVKQLRDNLQWLLTETVDHSDFWTNDAGWERVEKIRSSLKA